MDSCSEIACRPEKTVELPAGRHPRLELHRSTLDGVQIDRRRWLDHVHQQRGRRRWRR
ncbi:hypothetical protein [Amycolatopsis aidingensis]|uniref:hypothetical protein n=1 Tax=Amycolatopsis aidingensis TaxID=2842453 RepID=UPI001E57BFF0|nr:hypothetical protein [Amycolatopsis aidingensis]